MEPTTMVETATNAVETAAASGMASANVWAWICTGDLRRLVCRGCLLLQWVKKLPVPNAPSGRSWETHP